MKLFVFTQTSLSLDKIAFAKIKIVKAILYFAKA